jgi:hypothetical protein
MLRVLLTRLKAALCLGILSSCIFGVLRVLLPVVKITACVHNEKQWLNLYMRLESMPIRSGPIKDFIASKLNTLSFNTRASTKMIHSVECSTSDP